jgi:hypothetical protein
VSNAPGNHAVDVTRTSARAAGVRPCRERRRRRAPRTGLLVALLLATTSAGTAAADDRGAGADVPRQDRSEGERFFPPSLDADFESDGVFPPYEAPLTEGNGRRATTRLVDAPRKAGRAVRFVMPPSRGVRRDTPNRMQLSPAGDLSWRHGADVWYGISVYIGTNWKLSQVVDDRRHFASLFSFRWRDISRRKNGPGAGIKMSRVRGDSRPRFVAERETRGWRYRDRGGRDSIDLGPVVKRRWIDFVVHIRWSATRRGGIREYWRDGRLMGRSRLRNMGTDSPVIHRMGLYQGTAVDHQRTLYWDNHRVGRSYAEVDPSRE